MLYQDIKVWYFAPQDIQRGLLECLTSPSETCERAKCAFVAMDDAGWKPHTRVVNVTVQLREDLGDDLGDLQTLVHVGNLRL